MTKDDFVVSFKALMGVVQKQLGEYFGEESQFYEDAWQFTILENGTFSAFKGRRLNVENAYTCIDVVINQSVEYAAFRTLLLAWKPIQNMEDRMVGSSSESIRFYIDRFIHRAIIWGINLPESTEIPNPERIYEQIVQYFEDDRIVSRYHIYLENVSISSDCIELDPHTKILHISPEEKCRLLNTDPLFRWRYGFPYYHADPIRSIFFYQVHHVIEVMNVEPRIVYSEDQKPDSPGVPPQNRCIQKLNDVLTAIRLCGEVRICHSRIYSKTELYPFCCHESAIGYDTGIYSSTCTEFNSEATKRLKPAFELISGQGHDDKHFRRALLRLDKQGVRDNREDMLLDLMIGLEALVAKIWGTEPTDSISFKIAATVAKYLGDSEKEQKARYEILKKLYGKRSKIVHGNADVISQEEYTEIGAIYREFLFRLLEDGKSGRSVNGKELFFSEDRFHPSS